MRLTRAQVLKSGAAAVGACALSGCTELSRRFSVPSLPDRVGEAEATPTDPAWRVLNRLAYGPRPGDLERVREMGVHAYVDEQLAPERIRESRAAWMRLLPFETLDLDAADARDVETATYPEVGRGPAARELQQACVLRAIYSNRQLEQVMVEFWSDHFNVTQLKGECSWLKTVDDRLIRKHALGRFRDLLFASAQSPAMLFYLDNHTNTAHNPETGGGPNENYARELLELHSVGVDGGYTLKDIQETARCFTGWGYKKGLFQRWPGDFEFNRGLHDEEAKQVLSLSIPAGGGIRDGEQVLEYLAEHPQTARFLAGKLCRRFVADDPPGPLVARVARAFLESGGEIRPTLSELFHSVEFLEHPARKFKRPFDFTVSALRAVNADTTGAGLLPYLERMGQLPFKWTMPDGYPERVDAWAPGLLARWAFATDLLRGTVPGTRVNSRALARATGSEEPQAVLQALGRVVLGSGLPPALARLAAGAGAADAVKRPDNWLALLLVSPDFQWR
jgi:uncharacterized protein (DUF1800 family)